MFARVGPFKQKMVAHAAERRRTHVGCPVHVFFLHCQGSQQRFVNGDLTCSILDRYVVSPAVIQSDRYAVSLSLSSGCRCATSYFDAAQRGSKSMQRAPQRGSRNNGYGGWRLRVAFAACPRNIYVEGLRFSCSPTAPSVSHHRSGAGKQEGKTRAKGTSQKEKDSFQIVG